MKSVFDASVLTPLSIEVATSSQAKAAYRRATHPIAPAWVMVEAAQTLWKWARVAKAPPMDVAERYSVLATLDMELVDPASLVETALAIALARNHSVYDCLYVATALAEGADLVTADRRLARVAGECGVPVTLIGALPRP
jgi:predicted nucleic acid-binding protein